MTPNRGHVSAAFLWLWVAGVLALYLYQFRHLAAPLLRMVGLD